MEWAGIIDINEGSNHLNAFHEVIGTKCRHHSYKRICEDFNHKPRLSLQEVEYRICILYKGEVVGAVEV